MRGGDEDRATGVLALANEEPLMIVEARVDVMQEVIREDRGDSCGGVVWKGETPLRRGGCGSVHKRAFSAKNRDVSRNRGSGGHWGSEVFTSGGGNEDVVGVDGNIFVERGEEESVENLLGDSGRCGRHR